MSGERDYTPYQRRVIRNYYRNEDGRVAQRLAEIVTEIYLAKTDRARDRLWERARELLAKSDAPAAEADRVLTARDAEGLARLAQRAGG